MKQETKKGHATDGSSKKYIGNLGRTANGIVSVNAYAVVENITLYSSKSLNSLVLDQEMSTKCSPQLAVEILRATNFWV